MQELLGQLYVILCTVQINAVQYCVYGIMYSTVYACFIYAN